MKFSLPDIIKRQRKLRHRVIVLRSPALPATLAANLYRAAYAPVIAVWTEAIPRIVEQTAKAVVR